MAEPETEIDRAHAAMALAADAEADAARLGFYAALADAELLLLIEDDAPGESIRPRLFNLEEGAFVLAFDSEARLAAFAGGPAPYAGLPGRVLAGHLAGQGVGIGLNLSVAPSEFLMPPAAVDWLAETLADRPAEAAARPAGFHPPGALPEALLSGLAGRLARMPGLAARALLAGVTYEGGRRGHLLALVGARPDAEAALAKAVAEALTFSGIDAGELDVTFLPEDAPAALAMARVAIAFDIPAPVRAPDQVIGTTGPGMDPTRPPRLR